MQPVPEELQNGEGFGYVVAFRPLGVTEWIQTVVTSADTPRYVFRNDSIVPFSLYEVKVGVYNNRGEGPFSPVTTVFSAEEGTADEPPGSRADPGVLRDFRCIPSRDRSQPRSPVQEQTAAVPTWGAGPAGQSQGWPARNLFVRSPPRVPACGRGPAHPHGFLLGVRLRRFLRSALASGFVVVLWLARGAPSVTLQACDSAPPSSRRGPPEPHSAPPRSASLLLLPQRSPL